MQNAGKDTTNRRDVTIMKALKIKQNAEERHLKYYETNKYWLSIKAKTFKKIF